MAKQTGQRCKRFAVPGGRVCVIHGGAAPAVRAAAARRKAESEATALLELIWDPNAEPVTNPVSALQQLAGRVQHAANVLGARINTADLDGPTALAWSRVIRELRLVLEGMERLDLDAKQVKLEQQMADVVVHAFRKAVESAQLIPAVQSQMIEVYLERLGDVLPPAPGPVVRGELEA